MRHLDLFSGIGGFALAVDTVWHETKNEHMFVEWDPFCQAVLKKHWPDSTTHGDIRQFITYTERGENDTEHKRPERPRKQQRRAVETRRKTARQEDWKTCDNDNGRRNRATSNSECKGREGELRETEGQHRLRGRGGADEKPFILTGGFPCQPFSHAGRRKGTNDDRYFWPEMFRVVQLYRPTWVIAENVRGLATWNDGMVLETVCSDLESEGYEVWPLIIPAASVGAPHRRERIWIVAHSGGSRRWEDAGGSLGNESTDERRSQAHYHITSCESTDTTSDSTSERCERGRTTRNGRHGFTNESWEEDWPSIAARLCTLDDGLPNGLVRPRGWRRSALKAAGNAIVPQVAEMIMGAIKEIDTSL